MIVCLAIGLIVDGRSRLKLAALFGAADGLAFVVGAGLGWQLFSDGASAVLASGMLVALALYLLVVTAGTQRVAARWPVWVLPVILVFDNLTYGLFGDHAAGSLLQQAGAQALSSALLALVGLLAAAAMRPVIEHRVALDRVAGGALLLAAGGLVLVG
ncbi:MAG TPA: hypothetical protein VHJ39_18955 [Solirubrobacteraceae bacterium]|nr:hypothetical protein [Solirubrobacteraceae bacterium]